MKESAVNPLLTASDLPFGAPAFHRIDKVHYRPAFREAIDRAQAEIRAITDNPETPTFANTIEALERAGQELDRVSNLFFNLTEACTDDEMDRIAEEVSPLLTQHSLSILLNEKLFGRVKAVWENRAALELDTEGAKLLEETWKSFSRHGANLPADQKERFTKLSEELSLATLKFGQNVLAATNAYILHLTDEADLEGLPVHVREMAAAEAAGRGEEGWTFTLHQPSYGPFLKYSSRRDFREQLWRAYNSKCIGGENDNTAILRRIVALRTEKAQLLGYATYADYALENRMAKNPSTVDRFLEKLMTPSLPAARREVAGIAAYAREHGFEGELMPWDFSYWSEKYQKEHYELDEELLKPYFPLEAVQAAVFDLANRLYGLCFRPREDLPVYHPDVRVFDVTEESGRFMALLYLDYFPRESKRGGAWMTSFRELSCRDGVEERPFVSIVTNFSKPTADKPSLLTFHEVTTLLHEFGHALHGMLAEGRYASLTGTSVVRDFVELPSQLMENWAYEPAFLQTFAKHWQTGEVIPQAYIDRIVAARNFLAGYAQVRQLQFALTDMAWHTLPDAAALTDMETGDVVAFEQERLRPSALLPQVPDIVFSPSFNHIFSGGYAAGYYSYKWAEVLEADTFEWFKQQGIFSREAAGVFRREILSRGGSVDADVLYRNFRGRDPEPDALLKKLALEGN
ncbi:MAG: M3 family metallopeptidase [Bacteroidales bacterium]|nr:M3 family metallopeptidase [Bacteroidales bacterium]